MTQEAHVTGLSIEHRALADLTPSETNARLHSDDQIEQIAASIREFGWTIPLLIEETGRILAGHGRYEAAKLVGITSVPCLIATDWTEAQKQAYMLADNRLAENSSWDEKIKADQLRFLDDLNFDLNVMGFEVSEIDLILAEGAIDIDVDGDNSKTGKGEVKLTFGKRYSRMTDDEVADLGAALDRHIEKFGSDRGFVREALALEVSHGA